MGTDSPNFYIIDGFSPYKQGLMFQIPPYNPDNEVCNGFYHHPLMLSNTAMYVRFNLILIKSVLPFHFSYQEWFLSDFHFVQTKTKCSNFRLYLLDCSKQIWDTLLHVSVTSTVITS